MNIKIGILGKIAKIVSTTRKFHENNTVILVHWSRKNNKGKKKIMSFCIQHLKF